MDTAARFDDLFSSAGERRELDDGEVVLEAGARDGGLVRVLAGRLGLDVPHRERALRIAEVGPGTVLGSVSLLAGGAPSATATALGPATVEVVPLPVARSHVAEDTPLLDELTADAKAALTRDVLLRVLADTAPDAPVGELAAASRRLPVHAMAAGEVVTAEGDEDRTALLVLSGRCAVHRDGEEITRVGRGTVLGEGGLLTGAPRTATVVALRESLVAEIDESALRDLVTDVPAVSRAVLALLARAATATGAGRPHPRDPVGVIAVGSVGDVGNLRVLTTRVTETLAPFGRTQLLAAAVVDRALGIPGAAGADPDTPTGTRVAAYLSEREANADHLLLEMTDPAEGWGRRALRVADRVLLACPADPDDDVRAAVREVVDATPAATGVVLALHHPPGTERPTGTAALRDDLGADDVLHVREGVAGDLARAARLVAGRGTALALGGGGAPGYAHLGVWKALEDAGVPVDLVVGASIGAGMAPAIGVDIPRAEVADRVQEFFRGVLDYTIPVTSLIKGERIAAACETFFEGCDLEDLWVPMLCVSTNLTQSRPMVHARGDAATAVRASVAIPGVIPPVPWGEDLLVDGGVLNNLPVDVAANDPRCGTIVAVDVAPPLGPRARGDYGLSVSGFRALAAAVRPGRSEFPGLVSVLIRSTVLGSLARRSQALADAEVDLLLELHVRGVSLLDFDTDVAAVMEQGAALAAPKIASWLAEQTPTVAGT